MSMPLATAFRSLFFSSAASSCFLTSCCWSIRMAASAWALPSSCTVSGRTFSFSSAWSRNPVTVLASSIALRRRAMTRASLSRSSWSSITDFRITVLMVKQSIFTVSGILSISLRLALMALKFMSQSLGSAISSTNSCTLSGIMPTTSHGAKEFCSWCTFTNKSFAFWKTTAIPSAFRSGMTLYTWAAPSRPLNCKGREMKDLISLKYNVLSSSNGGFNFSCFCARIKSAFISGKFSLRLSRPKRYCTSMILKI
mmetsp:Transcript_20850/g.49496  ORF Transcript_20850/g.49496 Transcript_20850/m.49496 type:complete len:254 (-) Transcript_20850:245-1006(-)